MSTLLTKEVNIVIKAHFLNTIIEVLFVVTGI